MGSSPVSGVETDSDVRPASHAESVTGAERPFVATSGRSAKPVIRRRVLRAFGGPEGKVYESGEVVDVTNWRHAGQLVDQHKLSTETV